MSKLTNSKMQCYFRWRDKVGASVTYEYECKAASLIGAEPQMGVTPCVFIGLIFGIGVSFSSGGLGIPMLTSVLILGTIGFFIGKSNEDAHDIRIYELAQKLWAERPDK